MHWLFRRFQGWLPGGYWLESKLVNGRLPCWYWLRGPLPCLVVVDAFWLFTAAWTRSRRGKNMKIHYDTWKYFKRYENRWRSMKTSWNIGKYLEIYERTIDSMKRCWKPTKIHSKWKRVKLWRWIKHRTYENLWKYVETYKNPLGHMKTHQNIWKYMKLHDNAVSVLKIF